MAFGRSVNALAASRTREQRNQTIDLLYARLRKCEVGELVEYVELSRIAGERIDSDAGRALLRKARDRVHNKDKYVFQCQTSVGLQRADDVGIVECVTSRAKSMARQSRRIKQEVMCVRDINALSLDDRAALHTAATVANLAGEIASTAGRKKIEGKVRGETKPMDFTDTLRLFEGTSIR